MMPMPQDRFESDETESAMRREGYGTGVDPARAPHSEHLVLPQVAPGGGVDRPALYETHPDGTPISRPEDAPQGAETTDNHG